MNDCWIVRKRWMNEWMNEWTNACMNECTTECMYEWTNACMNECTTECMYEWTNACMNECTTECMYEWMNECEEFIHEWMNACMNEGMHLFALITAATLLNCEMKNTYIDFSPISYSLFSFPLSLYFSLSTSLPIRYLIIRQIFLYLPELIQFFVAWLSPIYLRRLAGWSCTIVISTSVGFY